MISNNPAEVSDIVILPETKIPEDSILFEDKKSDLRLTNKTAEKTDEDLRKSIFNVMDPQKVIDNFERTHGPKVKKTKVSQTIKKSRLFRPAQEKDKALFEQLMNNPKYTITYYKDTWTAMGEYMVFVIYTEMLDEEAKKPTVQPAE